MPTRHIMTLQSPFQIAVVRHRNEKRRTPKCPPFVSRWPSPLDYSCAGSGSMVFASTGTCTSSLNGVVIMNTRITGKASMKLK